MIKKKELLQELATPLNHPFKLIGVPGQFGARLQVADELLSSVAGSTSRAYEEYAKLVLSDSRVNSAFNKLVSEIVQRDWEIEPASQASIDIQIANDVTGVLRDLGNAAVKSETAVLSQETGFNSVVKSAAVAYITGIQPLEIIWEQKTGQKRRTVQAVKARDISRFNLYVDDDGTIFPRMLTRQNQVHGDEIPARRVIFMRYWNVGIEDEYGSGLGRQLYYLCSWKKELMTSWLSYVDRLAMPVAVGKYDLMAHSDDVAAFRSAVSSIGQEMGITMPSTFSLDFVSAQSANAALFKELLDYIDQQIAVLILGEATTGENAPGSMAKDGISNSIRLMKAKALSEAINDVLNSTLIRWIVDVRHGTKYNAPTVTRKFEEEDDPSKFADLIAKLKQSEIDLDERFVQDKLDMPLRQKRKAIESPTTQPEINI